MGYYNRIAERVQGMHLVADSLLLRDIKTGKVVLPSGHLATVSALEEPVTQSGESPREQPVEGEPVTIVTHDALDQPMYSMSVKTLLSQC
jgi:hypothetical protein